MSKAGVKFQKFREGIHLREAEGRMGEWAFAEWTGGSRTFRKTQEGKRMCLETRSGVYWGQNTARLGEG